VTTLALARTPEHMANLRGEWVTPVDGLEAWASVNYHGSEINAGPRIGTNGKPVTINGKAGRKYDAYTTLDIGAKFVVDGHARRVYRATPAGRRTLREAKKALRQLADELLP